VRFRENGRFLLRPAGGGRLAWAGLRLHPSHFRVSDNLPRDLKLKVT